jgi:hypothetical protein
MSRGALWEDESSVAILLSKEVIKSAQSGASRQNLPQIML